VSDASKLTPEATRVDGKEGVPFVLADGREWLLALPSKRFRPVFSRPAEGQTVECRTVVLWDYPRRISRLVDAFLAAVADPDPDARVNLTLVVTLGYELVRICHDLPPQAAADLFDFTEEEATNLAVGLLRMFRGVDAGETPEEPAPAESEG
jgi:hypothetical protein